jgi:hypothetical protein
VAEHARSGGTKPSSGVPEEGGLRALNLAALHRTIAHVYRQAAEAELILFAFRVFVLDRA